MAKLKVGDLIPLATAEDLEKVEEKLKDAEYTPYLTNYGTVFTAGEGYDKEGNAVDYSGSVVNGQVSGIELRGGTYTQLVKNGNFEIDSDGDGLADNWSNKTKGDTGNASINHQIINGIQQFESTGDYSGIQTEIKTVAEHKYYISALVKIVNPGEKGGKAKLRTYDFEDAGIGTQEINSWNKLSMITTPAKSGYSAFAIHNDTDGIGTVIQVTNVIAIDLTATFGEGNEPTVEECDAMFPYYFEGTKSTVGAIRVKSVGKNLFDFKNKGIKAIDYSVDLGDNYRGLPIQLIPNTTYTVQRFSNGWERDTSFALDLWQQQGRIMPLNISQQYESVTFTTDSTGIIYLRHLYGTNKRLKPVLSTIDIMLQIGETATPYEPYTETNAYVVAKDSEGNIAELRSLPNGTKDEIRVSERKLIKRTKKIILDGSENWATVFDAGNTYRTRIENWSLDNNAVLGDSNAFYVYSESTNFIRRNDASADPVDVNSLSLGTSTFPYLYIWLEKSLIDNQQGDTTLDKIKSYLNANPVTLIYQLAEPIEVPIQVTGNLKVYKNGSIFVDFIMPRKDNYGEDGINVGIPIKEIVSLYKVEKESGVERELNISNVEFSSDRTSFIHPDLEDGDLVKWEFVPDIETTTPITAIKYPINLKGQIESNSNAIQKISKDIDILDAKIIGNTQSIEDLSNKVGHNKQGIEELFTQVDSNKTEIESLDVRVTDNRNAIDQIGVIAVENQNMLADTVPQVNANRDNIEILEVEVNSVKSSVDGLNNRITETEQDMGSVQSEIKSLKQHNEQLNNYLRVDSNGNFIIGTQDNPNNIRVSDEGVTVTTNRLYIGNFVIEKYNNDILIIRPIE